jgi:hypothetical protein
MTIAISGKEIIWTSGAVRVSCSGGSSLFEINQDSIGWNNVSGGIIVDGVIPDGAVFCTEDLTPSEQGSVLLRFTGDGNVSYQRIIKKA